MLLYEQDEMTGTVAETEKPSSSSSSSSSNSISKQQQQQQQQQSSDVISLNLQCDEIFDETLADDRRHPDSAGSSFGGYRFHQPSVPQTNDSGGGGGDGDGGGGNGGVSVENNGAADDGGPGGIIDLSFFHKMKREWRSYGWYTSSEEMDEVRKRERVSKRKSVTSIQGTKVFYRCNNWRRTRCNFRMYAMIFAPNRMCLFASGEHDHTAKDPHYVTKTSPILEGDPGISIPATSQDDILAQFVINATANSQPMYSIDQGFMIAKEVGLNITPSSLAAPYSAMAPYKNEDLFVLSQALETPAHEIPYHLVDEKRITEMLQVATEIDHTFTFIERNSEFCFEPNDPALRGRSVVFLDMGALIVVIERYNGVNQSCETWLKSDWNQFLWAVRGKCMRVVYQDFMQTG